MNVLGLYKVLKENGIPDSQIVVMIADEYATNSRNPFKNAMYANGIVPADTWYNEETELDFRGSDVTVQNFFNAVLGIGPKSLQNTNEDSHVMIFVTGHGGDQFFKFQDEEELTAQDIANLMEELSKRKKFKKALFIADTCQAFTLFDKVTTPNVYALGTSLRDENAYAHHSNQELGLSVIERWTHGFLTQYRKRNVHPSKTTLHDLMVAPFEGKAPLGAHVGVLGDFRELLLTDFFGSKIKSRGGSVGRKVQSSPKWKKMTTTTVEASQSIVPRSIPNVNTHSQTNDSTSPENDLSEMSSIVPPLDPNDAWFGLLLGSTLALVFVSSRFIRTSASDDLVY